MVLDQPARTNCPGVRPSISHCTLPPLPSSTDRKIHTCGFVHFHSVTVPVSTITLSPSNAALLWCAITDVAASSTAMTHEPILLCDPPRWRRDLSTGRSPRTGAALRQRAPAGFAPGGGAAAGTAGRPVLNDRSIVSFGSTETG